MFYIEAIDYLERNFGFDIQVQPWEEADKLPVFLGKGYDYARMLLGTRSIILMNCSRQKKRSVDVIETHIKRLRELTGFSGELILIYTDASYYHRERMILKKQSFIVPGKQIYIPLFGTIFTEKQQDRYKAGDTKEVGKLSPTTQALLLELMCTNNFERSSAEIAETLKVTPMSVSRAFKELEKKEVIQRPGGYYLSNYRFKENRQVLWKKIYNTLSNPVTQRIFVKENSLNENFRKNLVISGESALSKISMIASPDYNIYGITGKEFGRFESEISMQPYLDEGACEIELWRHWLPIENNSLHPLAIALVLRDEPDERIQAQIDQMINDYIWEE